MPREPLPLVLVVDDDLSTRLLAEEALLAAGFEVDSVPDGEAALAAVGLRLPDLILLDVNMPGIDGYEVCWRLRARPETANVPVLVMTASDDVGSVDGAFGVGATDFLTKPLNLPLLGHRVRYLLRAARAIEEAHASALRLTRAQQLARVASWRIVDGRFEWSPGALDIFCDGPAPAGLAEGGLLPLVHPDDAARVGAALAVADGHQLAFRLRLPDGSEHFVHQEAELVDDGKGGRLLLGATQDRTQAHEAERQIMQLAFFDDLTGLPNRAYLHRYLRRVIAEARRSHERVAVLVVDVDVARPVNDTFGQGTGDELLREAAARVAAAVRGDDPRIGVDQAPVEPDAWASDALVARMTGDELVVVLRRLGSDDAAMRVASAASRALARTVSSGGVATFIRASVGVATFPSSADDPRTLLAHARAAMYHASESGGDGVETFNAAIHERMREHAELERRLRASVGSLVVEGGAADLVDFELHYQAKVAPRTGLMVGVEALLRWHPRGGKPVSPAQFIPVAEECGLIVPLGSWVLREACLQGARWRDAGMPLRVAVNVSPRQLREELFVELVASTLAETGFDATLLELEITEHAMMRDAERSARVLRRLSALGIRIALDDFGTGHSSLGYLTQLPIDVLKIDRSFVQGLGEARGSETVTEAILGLSRSLGVHVVAEGVETQAQLDYLESHGPCDLQGYLFCRPMPAEELVRKMMQEGRAPEAREPVPAGPDLRLEDPEAPPAAPSGTLLGWDATSVASAR